MSKKVRDPKRERTLVIIKPDGVQRTLIGEIIKRYEETNVYENNKEKKVPGKFVVVSAKTSVEDGRKFEQKIIVVYSQFYEGRRDYPNDNKQKRLEWFVEALDEIAELPG